MTFFRFLFSFLCGVNAVLAGFISPQRHSQRYARATADKCKNFVEGHFSFCSAAGYNETFQFPETLTEDNMEYVAKAVGQRIRRAIGDCAQESLAMSVICSFVLPQCSTGKRVLPCKRVCGEFLKQCESKIPNFILEYSIPLCHVLPDETASSGKCHEPPNFSTNDSVKGPLDRNCSKLIFPACKTLGIYNYTLVSEQHQKRMYTYAYRREYKEGELETSFPPRIQKMLDKYPRCQENIKKLYCGEYMPPCFADEFAANGHGYYTICQSVCDQIKNGCPGFFRNDFQDSQYCSTSGNETTSHGYCRRQGWPSPFFWARYVTATLSTSVPLATSPKGPATSPKPAGDKKVVIAVTVVVAVVVVGVLLGGAIWWKWQLVPGQLGYKKQKDDVAPLEKNMEL